jgi:hypothetical protein
MHLTDNTRPFIEAEQYSQYILMNLHDGLLGDSYFRNVSDFQKGDTLHIKTIGSVVLQEAAENTPLEYNPIETGEVTLQRTDYKGDAWFVTADLRADGSQIDALMAARGNESTRAIQEDFETRFLATAASGHSNDGNNVVNGFNHRKVGGGTGQTAVPQDFIEFKLAANKAKVPSKGRIFFVDAVVEASLNKLVTVTQDVTDFGKNVLNDGLATGMTWHMNLFGWDLIVTDFLPRETGATDGTLTVAGSAVINVGMCVLDDNCKPVMGAWRRQPSVKGEFNKDLDRDEFVVRTRFDLGIQRTDTLFTYPTSATRY